MEPIAHLSLPPSGKKLQLRKKYIDSAERRLNEQPEAGPIVLAEGISNDEYFKYGESRPRLPVRTDLVDGKVLAYEVSSNPHSEVAFKCGFFLANWGLTGAGDPKMIVNDPDTTLAPDACGYTNRLDPPEGQ